MEDILNTIKLLLYIKKSIIWTTENKLQQTKVTQLVAVKLYKYAKVKTITSSRKHV